MGVVGVSKAINAEPTDQSANRQKLSQQAVFDVLSARRRRQVLHYLFQSNKPAELRELSRELAAWENKITADEVSYKQRMRVYTALRQSHLPKMDEEGVVEFDPDSGVVELTDDASDLEVYLEIVPHNEVPWSSYYLLLGVFCTGALGARQVGLVPFDIIPWAGWAVIIVLLFTGSAMVHRYRNRKMRLGTAGVPPV